MRESKKKTPPPSKPDPVLEALARIEREVLRIQKKLGMTVGQG